MSKKFLSKKIIIPAVIFIGGLLVSAGVLMLANFTDAQLFNTSQVSQWTQPAGAGISVPACSASGISTTCLNNAPVITVIGDCDHLVTQEAVVWPSGEVMNTSQGYVFVISGGGCGSVGEWSAAVPRVIVGSGNPDPVPPLSNKTYAWDVAAPSGHTAPFSSGVFTTLNCAPPLPGDFTLSLGGGFACNSVPLSWTASTDADGYRILKGAARVDITPYNPYTALNFTDTSVVQNTSYLYQIEAYNVAGTNRSNALNVDTPCCPPTLNFSGDPTTIFEGQSSTLTWSSTYTPSCAASGAWSGSKALNGEEIVIPLPPPSVTYNLQCSGPGGTTPVQPVVINITPLGLPNWREIIPR